MAAKRARYAWRGRRLPDTSGSHGSWYLNGPASMSSRSYACPTSILSRPPTSSPKRSR
jgi:hypothetical protein